MCYSFLFGYFLFIGVRMKFCRIKINGLEVFDVGVNIEDFLEI